jgi:serine/threonine protein kinase
VVQVLFVIRFHFLFQVCTMGYLAPEAEGQGYQTPATDMYGFGLVLLGLFAGKRPLSTLRNIKVGTLAR